MSASTEQDYAGLLDAMLGKSAGQAPSYEEVRGRVHELLQSPAWSRAWLEVLDDLPADDEPRRPAPPDDELGGDHLVAGSKENIGLFFKAMGKKSEARQMFTEAARIRRKVLGADHLLTKKSERLAAQ